MIGGSQSEVKRGYQLLTGIGEVVVKAVNPTKDEYNEITGLELPYDLNYDPVEFSEEKYTPIKFLVHNIEHDKYDFVNFLIGHKAMTNRDGSKFRFIDKLGQITYFVSTPEDITNNPKVNFYSNIVRKVVRGEEELYNFLQALIRYSRNAEDANWTADIAEIGITPENLIKGDVSGLRKLIEFANTEGNAVGVVFTVQAKEKLDDEGNPETRYYQDIITKNSPFFWIDENGVTNGAFKRLKKLYEEGESSGYSLMPNRYFTFKLQPFVLEECYNYGTQEDSSANVEDPVSDVLGL